MNYAELCFWEFGDRVKNWTTLNEPQSVAYKGYAIGVFPPGRGGEGMPGNPATEPYIAAHNLLLSHAYAVKLYREKFQVMHLIIISLVYYIFKLFNLTNIQFCRQVRGVK